MGISPVISMLTKKYASLLGEFEFAERAVEDAIGLDAIIEATNQIDKRKKAINDLLVAIEMVIELFDPDWDPAAVRPKYPRKRHPKKGLIAKAAFGVLRDAKAPMTTREIARAALLRLGYEKLEERDFASVDNSLYSVFQKRVGTTLMIASHNPIRWALIPRDQARPRAKDHRPANQDAPETAESLPRVARRHAS